MSKFTLDEAIKHCLDIADGQDKCAEISVSEHAKERISQCAADHRQLAEWLTELKEAKRLLKVTYEDIKRYAGGMCRVCTECNADFECKCEDFCATNKRSKWKYKYEPEILALIGEEGEQND